MEPRVAEIAERVRSLREVLNISAEEMGKAQNMTAEEYLECERGAKDFSFMFLYRCAEKFGIDMIELLTGENPRLSGYSIVRSGKGLSMERRRGLEYHHLAANFRAKLVEPFLVNAPYVEDLDGSLKFIYDGHVEILNAGDSVYYNSGRGHGMIAIGGKPCTFLAIVMKGGIEKNK